jgi:hypothetical protein
MSILEQEKRELSEAVRLDAHGIEPVPVEDRDSTPLQQFWVWMGANLAPINWVLGTLGPIFGLSLVETILVVVIGNVVGCALFGLFATMGHKTGVNQMVLSRSAFGRRGAYIPSAAQLLLTMGWIGVNTWVILDLVVGESGILDKLGYHGGQGTRYVVGLLIMLVQVVIAIWGFYLIRTFEKYTVPVTAAIMVAMTALAFTKVDVHWGGSQVAGGDKLSAMAGLMTAIGIGWGISWLTMSADYPRFVNPKYSKKQVFWATSLGMFIPTVWLAILGAAIATGGQGTDPAQLVAAAFGAMAIPDCDKHPQHLLVLTRLPLARREGQAADRGGGGRSGGHDRADRVRRVRELRLVVRQVDRLDRRLDQPVGWYHDCRVLHREAAGDRRRGALSASRGISVRRRERRRDHRAGARPHRRLGVRVRAARLHARADSEGAGQHRSLLARRDGGRRRGLLRARRRAHAPAGHGTDGDLALGSTSTSERPASVGRFAWAEFRPLSVRPAAEDLCRRGR